jgi:hypothetical protein
MGHLAPLPKDAAVRAVNRAKNECKKKEKDDRKKKAQKKERMQLDRGKRRQGLEEEEGAYSSTSHIPWEDLTDEEEPTSGGASLAGPFPFHKREDAPLEPTVVGHSALFKPSKKREGLKRPRVDEVQPGSGGLALKHHRLVAPR